MPNVVLLTWSLTSLSAPGWAPSSFKSPSIFFSPSQLCSWMCAPLFITADESKSNWHVSWKTNSFIHLTNILFGTYNVFRKHKFWNVPDYIGSFHGEGLFQIETQQLPGIKFKSSGAYLSRKMGSSTYSVVSAMAISGQCLNCHGGPESSICLSCLRLGAWNSNHVKLIFYQSSRNLVSLPPSDSFYPLGPNTSRARRKGKTRIQTQVMNVLKY